MFQLIDSITNTCMRLADQYGKWALIGVAGVTAVIVIWRVVTRVMGRGDSNNAA